MRPGLRTGGGSEDNGDEMDLNLTGELWGMPAKLAGQVTTADIPLTTTLMIAIIGFLGVFLAAIVGVLGIYKDRKMIQKAESLVSRKKAYYNFVTIISELKETPSKWDNTTVTKLWKAALEAGLYGNLEAQWECNFHVANDSGYTLLIEHDLKGKKIPLTKESEDKFIITIEYLYQYISLLGSLQLYPLNNILKGDILSAGMFFSTALADKLLNETTKTKSWWQFWRKD